MVTEGIKIYKVKPEKETKRILELVFDETDKLPSKDVRGVLSLLIFFFNLIFVS